MWLFIADFVEKMNNGNVINKEVRLLLILLYVKIINIGFLSQTALTAGTVAVEVYVQACTMIRLHNALVLTLPLYRICEENLNQRENK